MELRHIRYFLAVAEERNFSRAAERLGIGQPPLSMQIRDLEQEVGARLFHRIPKGAELTAAGQAFYRVVERMPAMVEEARHAARRAERGELGILRIGFTASSGFNPVVATTIRSFRRGYPGVDVQLEESNTARLFEALSGDELDAAFMRPGEHLAKGLQVRVLSEEPLLAVLPSKHAFARKQRLNLADLAGDELITFPRQYGSVMYDAIMAACRNAGFEPKLGQVAPQMASIIHFVAAELGIALVPASMREIQAKGVLFRELHDTAASVQLSLAWRRGDRSPFLKNFIDCALSA